MSKIDLRVRDLTTGNTKQQTFESTDAALAFLKERPKMSEVLGVASHNVTREESAALRAAMRPLDDDEQKRVAELEAAERAAEEARAEERRKSAEKEAAAHREAMRTADPNRPMEVRYHFAQGLGGVDSSDEREITEEAKAAVLAWVAERNEWVASRNQTVGEAKVTVYPGPLPAGVTERVKSGGTFIPVAAPKKADN
ncbi:MAG: hypothetical protein HY908_21765 [Myxococcales bacterium]|nr:hypothetical protein [Myxococcales bacterium]